MSQKKSFALGYSYIVETFIGWLFYGLLIASGISTIIMSFSQTTGIASTTLFSVNTIGGYISVIGVFGCSYLIKKKSIRFTTALSYLISALGVLIVGHGQSIGAFIIFSALTQFFYHGYSYGSANALIGNWFPRKRGVVMGIVTAGIMCASFTGVLFMTKMTPVIGWGMVCNIIAGILLVLGIACWFWIRDYPEDVGLLPDNMPISESERLALQPNQKEVWTAKEILAHKDGILYIIGFGCLNMTGTGSLTITVPFLMELGYNNVTAVMIMSGCSIGAMLGSIVMGWFDTKLGTKAATLIMAVVYAVCGFGMGIFGVAKNVPLALAFTVLINFVGGGLANLGGSLVLNMYGRNSYNQAWRYLNTGAQLIKACCYAAIGGLAMAMGAYSYANFVWGIVSTIAVVAIACGSFRLRTEHQQEAV